MEARLNGIAAAYSVTEATQPEEAVGVCPADGADSAVGRLTEMEAASLEIEGQAEEGAGEGHPAGGVTRARTRPTLNVLLLLLLLLFLGASV